MKEEEAEGGGKNEGHKDGLNPTKQFVFQCCAFLTTMLLFTVAIVMIMLYVNEIENLQNRHRAEKRIEAFIGCYNESFLGESGTARFELAKRMAENWKELKTRNEELLSSIKDVSGKKKEGWKLFGGNLYFFSDKEDTFYVAQKDCEKRGTLLIDIASRDEEAFVEDQMEPNEGIWLGLRKVDGNWMWVTGKPLKKEDALWLAGFQMGTKTCATVLKCTKKIECWMTSECNDIGNWICKLRPDPRWVESMPQED